MLVVFKYEVTTFYAGLLSGLLTFLSWGWIVKKLNCPERMKSATPAFIYGSLVQDTICYENEYT